MTRIVQIIIAFFFQSMLWAQTPYEEVLAMFDSKQYAQSAEVLRKHLEHHPDDTRAIELLGDALGHQADWDGAAKRYQDLVERRPDNAEYHYKYGGVLGMKALNGSKWVALSLIGDIKRSFLTAASLDKNHLDVRWALVEFYMQLPGILGGSEKKALEFAEQLANLSAVDGHLSKGYIYEYSRNPELAEYHYKKAVETGGSLTCFQSLIDFYEHQNEPHKAVQNIERAHEKHQRNALHYQLGKVCADYNIDLDKGEQCLKVFIANHSVADGVPIEWAYYRLGQIYTNREMKAEALYWFDKALVERPSFKQVLAEKEKLLSM